MTPSSNYSAYFQAQLQAIPQKIVQPTKERGICAVTLSRFTGEKGVDISPQNKFLDDSLTPHLTIFNAGYRKKPSEPVFR